MQPPLRKVGATVSACGGKGNATMWSPESHCYGNVQGLPWIHPILYQAGIQGSGASFCRSLQTVSVKAAIATFAICNLKIRSGSQSHILLPLQHGGLWGALAPCSLHTQEAAGSTGKPHQLSKAVQSRGSLCWLSLFNPPLKRLDQRAL